MFLFLQEHWLPYHESFKLSNDFEDYNFLTTSADMFTPIEDLILQSGPVWHGTAIGWNKSLEKSIEKLPTISERFCGVKYVEKHSDTNIIAYTAYLPTSGQDEEFLEVLSQLNSDIVLHNTNDSVIIIGTDSNVSIKSSKRRYEAMQHFLEYFSLKTILMSENPTFHHNNQTSESQVDHILIFIPDKSKVRIKFKAQLCLKDDSSNISSHDVIIGEVELPMVQEDVIEKDYSTSYTPFIVKKPKWNDLGKYDYQNQTSEILQKLSNNYSGVEFIPILCEMFSRALVISAEKHFETSNPKVKQDKKKLPYFSQEYRDRIILGVEMNGFFNGSGVIFWPFWPLTTLRFPNCWHASGRLDFVFWMSSDFFLSLYLLIFSLFFSFISFLLVFTLSLSLVIILLHL